MRFAGGVQFIQRQLAAIFHLDHFLGVRARTGHKLKVVGQVHKAHVSVVGVNAVFHNISISCDSRIRPSGKPLPNPKPVVLVA